MKSRDARGITLCLYLRSDFHAPYGYYFRRQGPKKRVKFRLRGNRFFRNENTLIWRTVGPKTNRILRTCFLRLRARLIQGRLECTRIDMPTGFAPFEENPAFGFTIDFLKSQ